MRTALCEVLLLLATLATVATDDDSAARTARAADPQMPGVLVPRPVQVYGPDGGQLVQPYEQILYSYKVNPFETFMQQRGQAPVHYQQLPQSFMQPNQRLGQPVFQPQFFQAPGQQPFLYHPNTLVHPYISPVQIPPQQPQYYEQAGAARQYSFDDEDSGFERGHVESHPLQNQVQTYSSFREDQDTEPGLISRSAVESVPISAQVYTGLAVENSSPSGSADDEHVGAFSRGDVEAFPANLLPYTAKVDEYDETMSHDNDGYGNYGQAGYRQAVESPPLYTPQHDPAEAYPMPVQANSRPWGHMSESVLHDSSRFSKAVPAPPTPDVYSYYNPRVADDRAGYKIVCYYESWSISRPKPLHFSISDIDPFSCSHIIYSFAGLDESNYTIAPLDPDYDIVTGGYKAVVALKAQNPSLKVLIAIGGWNEGGRKYSRMVTSPEHREKFVKSVVSFLEEHHFDGLDLDWEYPGASDRGGRFSDKENFATLVKELSAEFQPRGWLLSAAVSPARFRVNEGYDVPTLGMYLDFINVMTYDLRGPWDGKADHHAPMTRRTTDSWAYETLNIVDGMEYWAAQGAPKFKLLLGVPFYGRTFTLEDPTSNEPGARATSGGNKGRYTEERGLLAYYEVCQEHRNGGWDKRQDGAGGPYMVKKDQWVGYDDAEYITKKMHVVRKEGYGGAMVWAIDLDDYLGVCGDRWPLLSAIRLKLADGGPAITPAKLQPTESASESPTTPEPEPEPEPQSTASTPSADTESATEYVEEETRAVAATTPRLEDATPAPDYRCPGPGFHRQEERCDIYFICNENLSALRLVCPPGLVFDLNRRICNWPRHVTCGKGYAPLSLSGCPEDGLFSHPDDCSMYIWCSAGIASHYSCPSGMNFDPAEGVCTNPGEVYCKKDEMVRVNLDNTTLNLRYPTFRKSQSNYRVVCFFSNWANNRPNDGAYVPENIDPSLCSHIIYAFSIVDPTTLLIKPFDLDVDISRGFYNRVLNLKNRQPDLKVMISLGGWVDSKSDKYTRLVSNSTARRELVEFAVRMLTAYGFDGLDLHWLYPACPQMNCNVGSAQDKSGFSALVSELRTVFDRQSPRLLLSGTVSSARGIVKRAYDVPLLSRNLDFINVMTYDFHTAQEGKTGHVAPLYMRPEDKYEAQNTAFSLDYWAKSGADRSKLVMGIPFYGQTFQLSNLGQTGLNAPVRGPGDAGSITLQKGMLSYMELCHRVRDSGWQVVRDPSGAIGPYAYNGDQWISYDDHTSIIAKSKFIRDQGFGGAMAWTMDFDDFLNKCCREPNPLLRTLARELLGVPIRAPRPGGDCSRPSPVVTPSPPIKTTTYDSGGMETKPTTPDWLSLVDPNRPQTARPKPTPSTTTQKSSTYVWTPPPTTTKRTTTTRRTTTSRRTTTTRGTTTTRRTTTRRPATTSQRTTTWWWTPTTQTSVTTTRRPVTRPPPWKTTTARPATTTARATTPAAADGPQQGDRCSSREYYPIPGGCSHFLRCLKGKLKAAKCAPGLRWNQAKKRCDWPKNVDCSPATARPAPTTRPPPPPWMTTRPTTFLPPPPPWMTTKPTTFRPSPPPWMTTKPSTIRQPPPPWMTTKPSTIRPQPPPWMTTKPSTTRPPTTITWWWRPPSTTRRPVTAAHLRPSTPTRGPCRAGTKDSVQGECSKFRVCDNEEWVVRDCAPGLEWNNVQQICDWKHLAGCHLGTREETTPTPGMPSVSDKPPSFTTKPCSEGAYKPDARDCSSYYMCAQGVLKRFTCQPPLMWNRKEKICDWEKNAKCKPSSVGILPAIVADEPVMPPEVAHSPPHIPLPPTGPHRPTTEPPSPPPGPPSPPSGAPAPPAVDLEPVTTGGSLSGDYMVVCYFTNWAWYRPGIGKYKPGDIDPTICTHIVYGFAVLDYSNLILKPHDSWADLDNKFYEKVVLHKRHGTKVSLALGGWNDSAGDKYSRLVNNPAARKKFNEHAIQFIEKYGFDGLDLDWEYPKCWQVDCDKGPASDKQAFADWIRELSAAFKPRGLLLSSAVSPSKKVIDEGYDVPALNQYLDWIAVMTYDYHGQWDKKTGHVAPSYAHPDDDIDYFNMDFTIRYWLEKGATKDKIVLGMPMYGQSFTLNNPKVNGLNAPARTGGTAGEFTRAKGFLAYYEICDRVRNRGWTVVKDPQNRMGPYAYSGNQWVSYDDVDTIRMKSEYIRGMGLAGGMIWALDLDDFRNRCGQGAHPLMNTIKSVLGPPRSVTDVIPARHPGADPPATITAAPTPERTSVTVPSRVSTSPPVVLPGPAPVALPGPPTAAADGFKVVCYFTNWAWYRTGEGKYLPGDIDSSLCTHIVYGFAVLDNAKLIIKPHDTWADFDNGFYKKVTSHKAKGVKVLIAIGGWNDSRGPKYSKLVNSPGARRKFTDHVVEFILKHNFDGLDLDWEYPKCWQVDCKKGPASDKQGFTDWMRELREAFQPHGLLLSAAVSPSNKVIDAGYEIAALNQYLDWIAVMTYDYHGQWDKKTGHVAPMYPHPEDDNRFFNTNTTIHYWLDGGADRKKIVMGLPMYGQSFTLSQASDNTLEKQSYGGGEAGPYTRARGFLAYYEICYFIKNQQWTVVRDPLGTMGPYAYRGNQWVGFDDVGVIQYKSEYIKQMGLGGAMIWALDLDDFKNRCGCEHYPLLRTINRVLRDYGVPDPGCPVLGGGPPSRLQPLGSHAHEASPTATTAVTKPDWMTERPTTPMSQTQRPSWQPASPTPRTTKPPRLPPQTPATTRPPWLPPQAPATTRPPWLPPRTPATTRPPWLPPRTPATTRPPWLPPRTPKTTTRPPWQPPKSTTKSPWLLPQVATTSRPFSGASIKGAACEMGEFKPHPNSCSKFYQCDKGKFEERKCFPGLHWAKTRCDWPKNAGCTSAPTIVTSAPLPPGVPTIPPVARPTTVTSAPLPPGVPTTPPVTVTAAPPRRTTATAVVIPADEPIFPDVVSTGQPSQYKVVCYFTNWAWYRNGVGKYKPEDIDPDLCTHIVYGFAVLDASRLLIKPHDTWADYDNKFYKKVTGFKKNGIKVIIAIGGWNDSAGGKYSKLVNSPEARRRFNEHVVEFILRHNFDGLDLDWEYPTCWQVNCDKGPASDKAAFSAWIRELHEAFQPHGLLLSAAVSPSHKVIDAGYEVPALNQYLDWIAVMAYDYHGHWDKRTGHVAPMFHHPESTTPEFNANYTIHYWLAHGADRQKLVMGMPLYGQALTLTKPSANGYNVKARGKGQAGQFTRAAGFLAYYEICDRVVNKGYTVVRDPQGNIGPYAYKDNQWVGYDDISMIRYKSEYIKNMGLGGAMVWALDLDDFRNRCGCEPHPLLRTINRALTGYSVPDPGCSI